jgi:hypothetical protein
MKEKTLEECREIWNAIDVQLLKLPWPIRNETMADFLENVLEKAKTEYYNGNPFLEDRAFDHWENNLKLLRPSSLLLQRVGS